MYLVVVRLQPFGQIGTVSVSELPRCEAVIDEAMQELQAIQIKN